MIEKKTDLQKVKEHIAEFEKHLECESLREAYLALDSVSFEDELERNETRRHVLEQWLVLMRLLDKWIDTHFDPEDVPNLTVEPPPSSDGTTHRPGVDPSRISDDKARAQYLVDIAANNEKAVYYSRQIELRRLDERITDRFEVWVQSAYTDSSPDQREYRSMIKDKIESEDRERKLIEIFEFGGARMKE